MTLSSGLIAAVALAYMATMFSIAFYGDRRHAPLDPCRIDRPGPDPDRGRADGPRHRLLIDPQRSRPEPRYPALRE